VADKAIGVISLYASDPDSFDAGEIKLLNELAQDIAFAMEFMENERRMKYIAFNDELTGLPNRAFLRRALEDVLGSSTNFALILLNMNGFRDINNTLGHHNGDELLRQIAQRLQAVVWGKDVVAALGGDDFGMLLPGLKKPEDVHVVLNKILQSLQGSFSIADIPIRVEAALGIALYPEHGEDAEKLWRCADVALRAAKETHRTHQFYRAEVDRFDPRQLGLMGELRDAITNGELVLHYQPKIDLKTGRPVGVEALVRWQSPIMGLIFPDKFIPLAEQTELINPLTVWVLEHALSQVAAWRKQGLPLDLSVNLSARSLQNSEMFESIVAIMGRMRMQFPFLTLEITESAIMGDPEHAREILGQLRDMGIGLAVDDYGIGQSSLNYLKSLPISKLKIDKSFIMDFANSRNQAIVRSTIDLAHNLGLSVIAEGVEDESTYLALRKLGCDRAQGYYFSRGLPAEQFIVWLNSYRKT
jgi:diguanylate cyclase (GGDEF)-like protein